MINTAATIFGTAFFLRVAKALSSPLVVACTALNISEKITEYLEKYDDLLKEFGGLEMIMYDLEVRKVFDKLKEYNK